MDYSPTIDVIISLAANEAVVAGRSEIEPEHLLMGILKFSEMDYKLLQDVLNLGGNIDFIKDELRETKEILEQADLSSTKLRRGLRKRLGRGNGGGSGPHIRKSKDLKAFLILAENEARDKNRRRVTPGWLLWNCLKRPTPLMAAEIGDLDIAFSAEKEGLSDAEVDFGQSSNDLADLTTVLKQMRSELLAKVFGQDHAIHAFVEGLFNAEVVAAADQKRVRPKAIFVFAGPPGVGKTYLAELGAEAMHRPFRRFDMSSYSDSSGPIMLAGGQRSFQGAKPGQLTGFVADNPDGILLFDEIEKADRSVIHLFLQLLDSGRLEDRYTERNVEFRDTIIIFTTNAGRSLYNDPNAAGISSAKATFHRKTILSALENETDPKTNRPFFPQAICSRLATGYPIMFNRLGVVELETIAEKELRRTGALLEKQYGKTVEFGPSVPLCLVMKEGAKTDARTVRSQAEAFVKSEMFNFISLSRPERLKEILGGAEKIVFDLDTTEVLSDEIQSLLDPVRKPSVLLAIRSSRAPHWVEHLPDFDFKTASDLAEAQNLMAMHDFDFILLDLWFSNPPDAADSDPGEMKTAYLFDFVPAASRSIQPGRNLLRYLHDHYPETPCYLLSFTRPGYDRIDDDLLMTSIRSGGARGVVESGFTMAEGDYKASLTDLAGRLNEIGRRLYRSAQADELGSKSRVLNFDTAPTISSNNGDIFIRIRNLRTAQAVAAEDVSAIISDAERPTTTFSEVYGADNAKNELQYIVNWLKNPKHFKNMDLRPPRGVLLYGPPGTGKTMLARALAGESDASFIVESATNFVTKWVGSGPENIRNLFNRARRYAPSLLFIDEIDAIGRKRSGESHNRSQEETLNALLTEMDGFKGSVSKPVIVIAATNLVQSLDKALIRRFDREVEVDKPDRAARLAYLRNRLQGGPSRRVSDEVLERVAGQSANMTIAELERVIQFAGRKAAMADGVIDDALIEEAFETIRMGEVKKKTDPETLLRVARHEAGHCLIAWLRGEKPVQITIVARGQAGGYVEGEADEDRMIATREDLEGRIRQTMAGRGAEILYYGDSLGLSTGVSGDLRQATHLAEAMVRDYGMGPDLGQVAIDPNRLHDGPLAIKVMEEASKIIKAQLDMAIKQLSQNRETLDKLVSELMDKNRLTREDLEIILGDNQA